MAKVVIFGNSLFAELCHSVLTHDSSHEVVGFTVDDDYLRSRTLLGLPVVAFAEVEAAFPPAEFSMMVSISFQRVNRLREAKYREAKEKGYSFVSYVSSRASTWPDLSIGENSFIGANCAVEPFARIGNNVAVTSSVVIGHHAVLHDHVFISPGAVILGGVRVGERSLVGANATIKESVSIGRDCVIGTGVSITRDTVDAGIYTNPPPELSAKRSDELRGWLSWTLEPGKPRWGGTAGVRDSGGRSR